MTQSDYNGLHAQVKAIAAGDHHLGAVLHAMLLHIGHAHGLDPAQAEADARAKELQAAREEEDKQIAMWAEARKAGRELEDRDKDTLTHAQANERQLARMEEDKRVQEAASALIARRKAEDARIADEQEQRAISARSQETPDLDVSEKRTPYARARITAKEGNASD